MPGLPPLPMMDYVLYCADDNAAQTHSLATQIANRMRTLAEHT
ncbi:hypothetical protein MTBUT4_120054 [Magnetospirillum sp. UT-4]|nr:hypothetical protein MTBUT4_120054 [Magnetospirillum sp. UT-4]